MSVVKFVSSISATPTVRLNLNAGDWRVRETSDLSPPPLRRASAATLLADGEQIPASAYDNRTLSLVLQLTTTTTDASATALQTLFRELNRPRNILMWHPLDATSPVFFRTYRTSPDAVTEHTDGRFRELTVDIPAEPFAYGLKTTLSPVSVTNNPATSCFLDVTGVKGDVETPAILTIEYGDVTGKGPSAVAIRRKGTPSATPFLLQAESMTAGTNTTLQANDAVMSGSGSNYMQTTFATATMQDRLTSTVHPASASVDARGRYRVFLRYRRANNTAAYNVELRQTSGTATATNSPVALQATTDRRWADLGLVQIPFGVDPVFDSVSGAEAAARGTIFTLRAEKTSGSGNVDFDVLVFLPADDALALITWPSSSGPTSMVVDGPLDMVYPIGGSGEIYPREHVPRSGGLPMLTPNQDARIYFLLNAAGAASTVSDDIASAVDITVSYYPRYLYVIPAST